MWLFSFLERSPLLLPPAMNEERVSCLPFILSTNMRNSPLRVGQMAQNRYNFQTLRCVACIPQSNRR